MTQPIPEQSVHCDDFHILLKETTAIISYWGVSGPPGTNAYVKMMSICFPDGALPRSLQTTPLACFFPWLVHPGAITSPDKQFTCTCPSKWCKRNQDSLDYTSFNSPMLWWGFHTQQPVMFSLWFVSPWTTVIRYLLMLTWSTPQDLLFWRYWPSPLSILI